MFTVKAVCMTYFDNIRLSSSTVIIYNRAYDKTNLNNNYLKSGMEGCHTKMYTQESKHSLLKYFRWAMLKHKGKTMPVEELYTSKEYDQSVDLKY